MCTDVAVSLTSDGHWLCAFIPLRLFPFFLPHHCSRVPGTLLLNISVATFSFIFILQKYAVKLLHAFIVVSVMHVFLTLGAHAQEGYGSLFVCVCVYVSRYALPGYLVRLHDESKVPSDSSWTY